MTTHKNNSQSLMSQHESYNMHQSRARVNHHFVLPPLGQWLNTPPTQSGQKHGDSFRPNLHLQAEFIEQQRGRKWNVSQMGSQSPVETRNPQSLPSISHPNSVDSTQDKHLLPHPWHLSGRPSERHILDAKSLRIYRTQGLNLLNPPMGTIDAHQSPFLTASTRPSEPMLSPKSLPTPSAGGRHSYFPIISTAGPSPPYALARADIRRPSVGFPPSGSASPIAVYSPYSQPGSVASSQFDTSSTPGRYGMRHPSVQQRDSRHSVGPMKGERDTIPIAPSGQPNYQLMTIKSEQGYIQIPVDVQAASKVADEKRRRHAGASARFRARRKEKEREVSMGISRFEQQLRNALEDAEFYRNERDYFKGVVSQQPRAEEHHLRPTSPRLRKPSLAPSLAPPSTRGGSKDLYEDHEKEVREEERNVRRRTSNCHAVF
jgi:hypothetical protein